MDYSHLVGVAVASADWYLKFEHLFWLLIRHGCNWEPRV
jgi:hypothetical protein